MNRQQETSMLMAIASLELLHNIAKTGPTDDWAECVASIHDKWSDVDPINTLKQLVTKLDDMHAVINEAYQVIGEMAEELKVWNHPKTQRLLDNLAEERMVHGDVLPFWISTMEKDNAK